MNTVVVRAKFNDKIKPKSNEHYFHFLWGFLLPLTDIIIDIESHQKEYKNKYFVKS